MAVIRKYIGPMIGAGSVATAVALLGPLVAGPFPFAVSQAQERGEATPAVDRVRPPVAFQTIMKIVPAPVIDRNAEFFIGTGDGANGSWMRY